MDVLSANMCSTLSVATHRFNYRGGGCGEWSSYLPTLPTTYAYRSTIGEHRGRWLPVQWSLPPPLGPF